MVKLSYLSGVVSRWRSDVGRLLFPSTTAGRRRAVVAVMLLGAVAGLVLGYLPPASGQATNTGRVRIVGGRVDTEVRNPLTLVDGTTVLVAGADGGSVSMTLNGERVALDSASLTALAAGTCTGFRGLKAVAPSEGIIEVPQLPDGGTEPLAGRTSLKFCNFDNSQDVHYALGAPDSGVVDLLYPGFGDVLPAGACATFNVGPGYVVRAAPAGIGSVNLTTLEAACPQ